MASFSHISELAAVMIGIVFYASLFFRTIKSNRENRGIVLGVGTVAMFGGFLFYAYLAEKHSPAWLMTTIAAVIILAGLSVITLVARDVYLWMLGSREPASRSDDRTTEPGLKIK